MDTKVFQIRDVRTRNIIGVKNEDSIIVPMPGQVDDFVSQYNALTNYDMGMVAELYDEETNKVDHFVILYAFKEIPYDPPMKKSREFKVLEATLSNLDILELMYQHNKNNEKIHFKTSF